MPEQKPKWRELGIELPTVSGEAAAALALHHLQLAAAYYNCLDLEMRDDGNPLERCLESNKARLDLVKRHLDLRYPENAHTSDFRPAAAAFFEKINSHWDAVWHDEYGPGED